MEVDVISSDTQELGYDCILVRGSHCATGLYHQLSTGEKWINCGGCEPSKCIDDRPGWCSH